MPLLLCIIIMAGRLPKYTTLAPHQQLGRSHRFGSGKHTFPLESSSKFSIHANRSSPTSPVGRAAAQDSAVEDSSGATFHDGACTMGIRAWNAEQGLEKRRQRPTLSITAAVVGFMAKGTKQQPAAKQTYITTPTFFDAESCANENVPRPLFR